MAAHTAKKKKKKSKATLWELDPVHTKLNRKAWHGGVWRENIIRRTETQFEMIYYMARGKLVWEA